MQGVTYCGESKASKLTMENVPWHREVVNFTQQLADRLPNYELASEHEHSNCVLIAHTKVTTLVVSSPFVSTLNITSPASPEEDGKKKGNKKENRKPLVTSYNMPGM